jgi:predicted RNA binding protein YcfA (HicA-like mRNA interferase family)
MVFFSGNIFITFVKHKQMKYSELFRILNEAGWHVKRQKGSHCIMQHPDEDFSITIPNHPAKEVKSGLLKTIIKQTGIKTDKR